MTPESTAPRVFAGLIALTSAVGIILQLNAELMRDPSIFDALWTSFRFFTVITNLAVAIIFASLAANRPCCAGPRTLTGLTLSILLVGIVYQLLLADGDTLIGTEVQATVLLHKAAPLLVLLYWLGLVRKGHVGHHDPLLWSIYPIAYLLYALARGGTDGDYAYPFIDPTSEGWSGVGMNVAGIAAGFLVAGYLLVWMDRKLAAIRRTVPA